MVPELAHFVIRHGVYAVAIVMALDAMLPTGGEVAMLAAGAVAAGAVPGVHPVLFGTTLGAGPEAYVVLASTGTLGSVVGAVAGWGIGRRGGGALLRRHGRGRWVDATTVARAERWLTGHRNRALFLGRLTPVVRSFVAVPAGALHTPIGPFVALTFAASAVWCFAVSAAGWIAGRSYEQLGHALRYADIVAVAVALAAWLVVRGRLRAAAP